MQHIAFVLYSVEAGCPLVGITCNLLFDSDQHLTVTSSDPDKLQLHPYDPIFSFN